MRRLGRQQGFSAITAVVLIVLLGLIGAYMATLTGVQSLSATLGAGAERARFASSAGIDWGAIQALTGSNSCPPSPIYGNCTTPSASTTIDLQGAANGFSVTVDCTCTEVDEGPPVPYNIYRLISTATRGSPGEIGYVMRRQRATVADTP